MHDESSFSLEQTDGGGLRTMTHCVPYRREHGLAVNRNNGLMGGKAMRFLLNKKEKESFQLRILNRATLFSKNESEIFLET